MTAWNKKQIGAALCRGVFAASLLAATTALSAQQSDTPKTRDKAAHLSGKNDPETCIKETAKMNLATIQFGQLATQKAQNAELKRFGQTIEQDHRKAQSELETIAKKHNVTLPTTIEDKCREELTRLQGLSGQEFDQEFAKGAVEGHAMAAAHLQHATTEVKDADLQQYTKNMLAKIKDHQRRGRQVAQGVGIDQATITALETKAANEAVGAGAGTETSTETSPSKDRQKQQPQ
jgi:putative membrane protein